MVWFKTFELAKKYGDKNYLHPIVKEIKLTNDELRYNVYEEYGRIKTSKLSHNFG